MDAYLDLRQLIPHGQIGVELRAISRDDLRAAREERRLGNRLRADLLARFPAAIDIAGSDLGSPVFLKLLERWPTATDLAAVTRDELAAFARSCRHGRPGRFADHVTTTLAQPRLQARPELVRAKAGSIRPAAAHLLLLRTQRKAWQPRMGELLLAGPRTGRDKTVKDPDPGQAFPGGEIYLSMPSLGDRLGDRLAARIAGQIGEHTQQSTTPNALQCYAGQPPITRRSGRSQHTIARRLADNRYLGQAVQQWAFCSPNRSAWTRQLYHAKNATDDRHTTAPRKLGNR